MPATLTAPHADQSALRPIRMRSNDRYRSTLRRWAGKAASVIATAAAFLVPFGIMATVGTMAMVNVGGAQGIALEALACTGGVAVGVVWAKLEWSTTRRRRGVSGACGSSPSRRRGVSGPCGSSLWI